MSEKKVKYNEVVIAGEVLDIKDIRKVNEDTESQALTYKLHIETAPNEVKVVEFFTNMFKTDDSPNTMYLGVETICNEIITKAETGQGDKVRCICTLDDNSYYANGKLVESTKIAGNFCNREEEGKTIKADQFWKVDVLVDEIETKTDALGEYTHVKGLVNKYGSNGLYVNFRIHDAEMREGFKQLYRVGSVGKLEGTFQEIVSAKTSGFGKSVRREIDRYLEIEGGEETINTIINEDGTVSFKEISDTKNPFHIDNINAMREKINIKLTKSKEKDEIKTANTRTISDEEVPF